MMAVMLVAGTQVGATANVPATAENLQAWQAMMAKNVNSLTEGCATADYPSMAWEKIECVAPPSVPMAPKASDPTPLNIGEGTGVVAEMPAAQPITQATGSFDMNGSTGPISVKSPVPGQGVVTNAYTLQLNTEFFKTSLCALGPELCRGWQQFVFANDGTTGGKVFIEYWLLSYKDDPLGTCPDSPGMGLNWERITIGGKLSCYLKSAAAPVPNMPLTRDAMSNYRLVGDIVQNVATFMNGTRLYLAPGPNVFGPKPAWTMVEYNVFGYGDGSVAEFNLGADFRVRTDIVNGTTVEPKCVAAGFSSESNNLNFVLPKPPRIEPGPAILFHEKMINLDDPENRLTRACNAATTIGDTHQVTFGGLLYDFQATGDFVEAQVGTAFEVQTRKTSGGQRWPNTSVNQSVATRMGSTQVAICEGTRLVVDGRTTTLVPGDTLSLPSGVQIRNVEGVYHVKDQAGNSIRVTPNRTATPHHVNLDVGLATWPTTVRGLLGHPDNNPAALQGKDGRVFYVPVSFNDLYNIFGPSWRVAPIASLLQSCNAVASGIPSAPFYIDSLDRWTWESADRVCQNAGVPPAWRDSCALDVAVLGSTAAAAVYVGREPPVRDNNPEVRPPCSPAGCALSGQQPPR
jgi:hypothetical protein